MPEQTPIPHDQKPQRDSDAGASRLMAVANTALVGIPAAYATSGSITITSIATIAAFGFVILAHHRR
ncbi:hypothetical protein DZF91_13095 [Actinomadura logoneensis]|uniref:Uncharacterized protein n=1 Tax=Actinomadura logoneensis TaxID=2293572 RepID=A0A372JMF7_9ACTN|nr:hypothetical protein [Actinomadura logoneensis]RFU41211.1 hypothetical protein DZF91_13095 [Actinomadura logoneensis]